MAASKNDNMQICPFCHKQTKDTLCIEKHSRIFWLCWECYKKEKVRDGST